MIEALKEAFNEVAQLPEDEQRHIVEIIKPALSSRLHSWGGMRVPFLVEWGRWVLCLTFTPPYTLM